MSGPADSRRTLLGLAVVGHSRTMSVMLLDPPTLQIRGARLSDAARITRCYLASRQTMLPYAPLPHTDDQVLAWISDLLLPTGGLTVALESGAVVGFIATAERAGSQWVDQLYVHPTRLRRGVGSTLLHLALARWQGPVRLYCFEPNKVARRFYEHYGFVAIGFGDGSNNESRCPDVLYERSPDRG